MILIYERRNPVEKVFPKREEIYRCLCSTDTHPSAQWIYERLRSRRPDISLATVYRNLARFKQEGRILSVGFVNGQERFDGNTAFHPHFICSVCGSVEDLTGLRPEDSLLPQVAMQTGGRVDGCCLSFQGVCRCCLSQAEKPMEN